VSFSAEPKRRIITDLGACAVWRDCKVYLEVPQNHLEVPIEVLRSNSTWRHRQQGITDGLWPITVHTRGAKEPSRLSSLIFLVDFKTIYIPPYSSDSGGEGIELRHGM